MKLTHPHQSQFEEHEKLMHNMPLILNTGTQAGISGQELVALLNKSLDISRDQVLIKKMVLDLELRRVSFDNYFIFFGIIGTTTTTTVMLQYLQDLIVACAGNVVTLVGTGANYGVGGIELVTRNTAPFIWNNVISFTNYIGILTANKTDSYKLAYATESITAAPIMAVAEEITQNASLAALVVNIFLFMILVPLFTLLVILMLKMIQTRKLTLSFLLWKIDAESRS